jgi:predicted membrane protein
MIDASSFWSLNSRRPFGTPISSQREFSIYSYIKRSKEKKGFTMSMDPILALIAIIFGILVIAFENLLNWIVGIFFILLGLWLLIDYFNKSSKQAPKRQQTQQTLEVPPPSPPEEKQP